MRDQLQELLVLATRKGVSYADLRLGERQSQPLLMRDWWNTFISLLPASW